MTKSEIQTGRESTRLKFTPRRHWKTVAAQQPGPGRHYGGRRILTIR